MSTQSDDVFVAYGELASSIGISFTRIHLRRLIDQGLFPQAYQISPNRIAWKLSELAAWKASRAQRRRAPTS